MASEPNSLRRAKLTPLEREAFLERFDKIASGQPAGRLRFQTKRLLWLAVVRGTYSFKRLFDIGFSAILLVSLALFFLLIAILIKLESPGPVFFQQTRVGRWGRTFQMWIWQVSGRSNNPFPEQVEFDLQYIESQSFWTDMWILLQTVPAVLLGRGAY